MIQFQGDLELISFSDVLQFLSGGRKTGALVVERPDGLQRQVFFDKGEIIAASSSRVDDYLGRILVRRGAVPEAEVEKALQSKPPGMRLGDALVARGLITEEELQHFLFEQFRKIIFDTFTWAKGAFRFVTGARPEGGRVAQSMSADNLVLEGLRRLDEGRVIERRLPPEDALLAATGDPPPSIKISTIEGHVLGKLQDGATRKDLLRSLRTDEFELRKAVFKLYEAGLIAERSEAPGLGAEAEERLMQELRELVASYNGIFSLIFQSLKLELGREIEPPLLSYFNAHPVSDSPVLQGLSMDGEGSLDVVNMLKNAAALPVERRRREVQDVLSKMLAFQLGIVREKVGPDVATGILEMCSTLIR